MPSKIYTDPCTFSNPGLFHINHVSLNWNIDFSEKTFKGSCDLDLKLTDKQANQTDFIILDTRELSIFSVTNAADNTKLNFELEEANSFGRALKISLSNLSDVSSLTELKLRIEYITSATASALQWLEPNATMGKKHPYLFSQCQAIHARSIVPCQDTPSIKFTYDATVTVQKPLTVLMSAVSVETKDLDSGLVEYKFDQKIRMPSYLLAIAVGDLVSKDIGPVSRVWTEKDMIDKASFEFEEVDSMIKDAEGLLGEYVWGRYDILVLPPSFPYGGMENPCLTFVTPTIIAGDRSLVTVIQHEITHSWTGNLVTNCSWEHFWLNEGFTRFIERKLIALYNKNELCRHFECLEGWRDLVEEVKHFGENNQLTQLVTNLKDVDPDDAFSSIPYEKGHMLLFYLEQLLGGPEVFDQYVKAHIEKFKGLSIDTDDWKQYLYEYFCDKKDILDKVDWNTWLYQPGMPPVDLVFDETLANQIKELVQKLLNEEITCQDPIFSQFTSNQKRELLSQLLNREALSLEKIDSLNKCYKFGETQNSEILFRWLRLGIKANWTPIINPALKFVSDQGRMKFTRPVYRDLYAWEESRQDAIENFLKQREFMHQTTASLVAKDLNLA